MTFLFSCWCIVISKFYFLNLHASFPNCNTSVPLIPPSFFFVQVPNQYLVCIGMGVDTFHGVNHVLFLENVAALAKQGAFLGAFSLLHTFVEAAKFENAYKSCHPQNSIVCSSVLSAVQGEFGDFHSPHTKVRTGGSKLFISPLMSMYWCFRLAPVAQSILYLDLIKNTASMTETSKIINTWHSKAKKRIAGQIPY